MPKRFAVVLLLPLAALVPAAGARADIFVLQNDGQVRGELVNKDESPRKIYVIKTASGGQVTLEREQVKQLIRQTPAAVEYDKIHAQYPDTIAGQWALAEWCRERRLEPQSRVHLERIVTLDPNHANAHHALGHSQLQGRWISQEQHMKESGYVYYRSAWRTPQEIELMERDKKADLAQKDWLAKMKRWRSWLGTEKHEQARASILAIADPFAVKALATYLSGDETREIKQLFIDALAHVGAPGAMDALVRAAMDDPDEEVRLACLDKIVAGNYRPAVGIFIQGLKHKENVTVNRAAVGLAHMKDPTAVGPLIDALVTTHSFKIVKGPPGQTSATFGNGPGGGMPGFSFGGGGTEIRKQQMANHAVLEALVRLTEGVNFNFDTKAWKYWYAAEKKPSTLSSRRD